MLSRHFFRRPPSSISNCVVSGNVHSRVADRAASNHDFQVGRSICAVNRMVHRSLKPHNRCWKDLSSQTPSGIHAAQALTVTEHDLTGTRKPNYAVIVELRKCSGDSFEREPQIISNAPATHRKCHNPCVRLKVGGPSQEESLLLVPLRSYDREAAYDLLHVELAGGHSPKAICHFDSHAGCLLQAAALTRRTVVSTIASAVRR
jgi:hypothetical protein